MISLVIVNYRSAAHCAEAVRSARATTQTPLQIVVVDNSEDAAEADALRGLADDLVVAESNGGYSGGVNAGRTRARGEVLLFSNPDVVYAPGAIDRLAAELTHAAVAGPLLSWDDAHQWILPPSDRSTTAEKVDEVLASRSGAWAAERDRRRTRRRIAFWSLHQTTQVETISGAVMAVRAEAFDALGGFDPRFPLYFEETDFLRRLRAQRGRIVYVPAARCRHLYNQSAGQVRDHAAAAFLQSERRYLEKWSGPFAASLLKRLERSPVQPVHTHREGPLTVDPATSIVEVSPLASFATAAGHFPEQAEVELPEDVWSSVHSDRLFLRVVNRVTAMAEGTWSQSRV